MGCFGFNLIRFRQKQLMKLMTKHGLENKQLELPNGTSMDCWAPSGEPAAHKPGLLLLHGFVFNALLEWENQIPVFSDKFNLYIPNLIFSGNTTTASSSRSEIFQAECMKQMLDELKVSRVHVLGTSYGGMVVFWMAHLFPSLVDRVVLGNCGILMNHRDSQNMVKRFGCGATGLSDVLMPQTVSNARKSMEFATQKSTRLLPDCLVEDIIEEVFCYNREQRQELLDGMEIGSIRNAREIPVLPHEVLIVWGELDQIFPLEMAHQLHRHLGKSCNLEVIPGVAHLPQQDSPKAFNQVVLGYLQ